MIWVIRFIALYYGLLSIHGTDRRKNLYKDLEFGRVKGRG
jgi:hypothetical protein